MRKSVRNFNWLPIMHILARASPTIVSIAASKSSRQFSCSGALWTFLSADFQGSVQKDRVRLVHSKVYLGRASRACLNNDDDVPSADIEGLSVSFHEEVRRRQLTDEPARERAREGEKASQNVKAPRFAKEETFAARQLERSRELQNEGLRGFSSRARDLLTLGLTSFTSFGPLIAVFSVSFVATYLILGSDFIHSGDMSGSSPTFISPERLLKEESVDKTVQLAKL